ncbi:MAG: hypothetical protein KF729_07895 [Sandaracinaceae bacterium]|nr:hypothetical protein [Sandaracinaceae bacterium]
MAIPTNEIRQPEQDAIIEAIGAPYGDLGEAIQDRVVRDLHACWSHPEVRDAYLNILGAGPGSQDVPTAFPDLPEAAQRDVLDTFALFPGMPEPLLFVLDRLAALDDCSSELRDAIVRFVARPLRLREATDEHVREDVRSADAIEQGPRLSALAHLLGHPTFRERGDEERRALVRVMDATGRDGLPYLLQLLEPETERWAKGSAYGAGTVAMFTEDFVEGLTLLAILERAAQAPLNWSVAPVPAYIETGLREGAPPLIEQTGGRRRRRRLLVFNRTLKNLRSRPNAASTARIVRAQLAEGVDHDAVEGQRRGVLLDALLTEIADPSGFIDQNNRGTCAITVLVHRLAEIRPAEYARIATDLFLGDYAGRATAAQETRLANGDRIRATDDALDLDVSARSASERLMQSALMRYWREGSHRVGQPESYRNVAPSRATRGTATGEQTDAYVSERGWRWKRDYHRTVEAVLHAQFALVKHGAVEQLRAHFTRSPGVPVSTGVHWGTRSAHQIDVVALDESNHDAPVVRFWNPWGATPMRRWGSILVDVDDGVQATGTVSHDDAPRRRTVAGTRGIQEMSLAVFRKNLMFVLLPR